MRVLLIAIVVTLFIPLVLYSSLGHSSSERKAVSEEVQHSKPKNTGRKLDSVYTGISKSQNKPKIPVSIIQPTKNVSTEPTSNPTSSDTPGDPTRTDKGLSRGFLESLNSKEIVYNSEKYQALAPDDVVFIIQVHKRIHYLRYLLESFEAAKGIEKVLLIFSHDYYDEEINNLIRSIKYTKVGTHSTRTLKMCCCLLVVLLFVLICASVPLTIDTLNPLMYVSLSYTGCEVVGIFL